MNLSFCLLRFATTFRRIITGFSRGIAEFRKASSETMNEISKVIEGDDDDPPAAA
jgi:hypothetical protein